MALLKMRKLPKKPKASASAAVLERYLKKVDEIKKENQQRKKLNDYHASLKKKVASVSSSDVAPGARVSGVRKKSTKRSPAKKTARKKSPAKRRKR